VNKLLRTLWTVFRSKRRPTVAITDVASMTLRVRPTDLDIQRHMNNGVYLSIADLGRFDLLIRSGFWAQMRSRGWYPVVQSATITYRRSLEPWQRYTLETRFAGIDDKCVYIEQRFVVDGHLAARLHIKGRFLQRSGGTVPMDELVAVSGMTRQTRELPEWITRWGDDVALPASRADAPSVWD
jgi:acyl-CoA thioesterase FadM